MWHIDTTVIRLLDGTRAYVHAVIDNFSRRILAWRVADTFAAVNSVTVLLEAIEGATRSARAPVVLADAGVENVNGSSSTHSIASQPSAGWWRSTSTNTTTCFRIRRFEDRRRTRCISAPETGWRRTSRDARSPRAEHAWRPTDRHHVRRARHSARSHDRRLLTTTQPRASNARATQDDCKEPDRVRSHEPGQEQCPDSALFHRHSARSLRWKWAGCGRE